MVLPNIYFLPSSFPRSPEARSGEFEDHKITRRKKQDAGGQDKNRPLPSKKSAGRGEDFWLETFSAAWSCECLAGWLREPKARMEEQAQLRLAVVASEVSACMYIKKSVPNRDF